jgi:hypothetical protein
VISSLAPDMTGADGDERFDFGLSVLIAGLEATSAAQKNRCLDETAYIADHHGSN